MKLHKEVEKLEKFDKRRKTTKYYAEVVYIREGQKRKTPKKFKTSVEYDFLQYVRIVRRWASKTYDITEKEVEVLLYLYPIGIFTKADYTMFSKTLVGHTGSWLNLRNRGLIKAWRREHRVGETKDIIEKEEALYSLGHKALVLCGKMHNMCTGETEIPQSFIDSLRPAKSKLDAYYKDIIGQMNRKMRGD